MLNRKAAIVFSIVGLIKKTNINEWIIFKTKILWRKVKVELDLSNYATKTDLKNLTCVDTPKLDKEVNLASLKSEVDKLV